MPETVTPPKVTWRAGADRVAHAHRARELRTACGMEIVAERLAWTKFRNCMVCAAALEDVPEGEARLLHGDR